MVPNSRSPWLRRHTLESYFSPPTTTVAGSKLPHPIMFIKKFVSVLVSLVLFVLITGIDLFPTTDNVDNVVPLSVTIEEEPSGRKMVLEEAFSSQDTRDPTTRPNKNIVKDSRPFLVLHIGPSKTGTTSIQAFLASHRSAFQKDNYKVYILDSLLQRNTRSRYPYSLRDCLERPSLLQSKKYGTCYKPYLQKFVQHARMGHNVIHSHEHYARFDHGTQQWKDFYTTLQKHFQVKVVYYYRRNVDRLISLHNQWLKKEIQDTEWTDPNQVQKFPSYFAFPTWLETSSTIKKRAIYRMASQSQLLDVVRALNETLRVDSATQVEIRSFYADNIVEDFSCHAVPNANLACRLFQKNISLGVQNPSKHFDYTGIVIAAKKQGILSLKVGRTIAEKEIERYHREVLNQTMEDLPQLCLSGAKLQSFRQVSYDLERQVMPSMLASHDEAFFKKLKNLCTVDASKVLEDPGWRSFVRNIT